MRRLFVFVFIAALLIVSKQLLTVEDITTTPWKFYNDGGFLGTIYFTPTGKIANYNNSNENSWVLNANRMLEVYDINGAITARYV